jgi:membrane-anchored protein YejM (alkaline phosphatase superfamily)
MYSPELQVKQVCDFGVAQRIKSYFELLEHTHNVLEGDQADFIFLHLPIPHPPAIWDRLNDRLESKCGNSYVDNLALADHTLGDIVATLQRSPRWKDTTVVVQGDHSWRTKLWDSVSGWTDEDDRASRGKFDPRPAVLIHNPGQMLPETDGRALPLLFVHDALEGVLQGKAVQP